MQMLPDANLRSDYKEALDREQRKRTIGECSFSYCQRSFGRAVMVVQYKTTLLQYCLQYKSCNVQKYCNTVF